MNAGRLPRDVPPGWRVKYLNDEYDPRNPDTPRYEVFPPEGYRFDSGEHSRLERYARAVRSDFAARIQRCPSDCDCQALGA